MPGKCLSHAAGEEYSFPAGDMPMDGFSKPIGLSSDSRILLDLDCTPHEAPGNLLGAFSPAPSPQPSLAVPMAKRQGASCQAQDSLEDQHSRLLMVLGDHLEKVGKTLSVYAAAESDARSASKVLQPGTLRGLQNALLSLISDNGYDFREYTPCKKDVWYNGSTTPPISKQMEPLRSLEIGPCGSRIDKQEPLTPKASICNGSHESPTMPDPPMVADLSAQPLDSMESTLENSPPSTPRTTARHAASRTRDSDLGLESIPHMRLPRRMRLLMYAEYVVAAVILVYAAVLGISVDIAWKGWNPVEYAFTLFFLSEVFFKWHLIGVEAYFFGDDWTWNWFDFAVAVVALVDSALTLGEAGATDLSIFTTLKLIRLGRIARLIRLLRFKIFAELKSMVTGVITGFRVLLWAMVLFFAFIYIVALALRQTIGGIDDGTSDPMIRKAFESMPASMNTLFMCFTDGCTASNGTPLQVHFYDDQGIFLVTFYMVTMLFVTVGLFNLIMAIFVDNVLEKGRVQKLERRAQERRMLERQLRRTVKKFLASRESRISLGQSESRKTLSQKSKQMANLFRDTWRFIIGNGTDDSAEWHHDSSEDVNITRDVFAELLEEPDMTNTLSQLDIETSSQDELFDVLDADMSGRLEFDELIAGLMSLRGPAEKKDIIGSLLCIRATQQYLRETQDLSMQQVQKVLDHVNQSTDRVMSHVMHLSHRGA